ncbi:unnamed protein product [Mycena citricolor]|uniref:Uncharacterized protein n=1 Tax=Mycena citricolor TaxID=2018698 RepID=A0AAD2HWS4_9AGAR|nr:unnamed protein product [Mycena citricolor]
MDAVLWKHGLACTRLHVAGCTSSSTPRAISMSGSSQCSVMSVEVACRRRHWIPGRGAITPFYRCMLMGTRERTLEMWPPVAAEARECGCEGCIQCSHRLAVVLGQQRLGGSEESSGHRHITVTPMLDHEQLTRRARAPRGIVGVNEQDASAVLTIVVTFWHPN